MPTVPVACGIGAPQRKATRASSPATRHIHVQQEFTFNSDCNTALIKITKAPVDEQFFRTKLRGCLINQIFRQQPIFAELLQ